MRAIVAFALTSAAACGVGESKLPADFAACPETVAPPPEPAAGLTYWHDVKPIVDARCVGCHREGGVAPFRLDNFADLADRAGQVEDAVVARIMPPWQPNDCCGHYRWSRSLSEAEIATLVAWRDQGLAQGSPSDEGEPIPVDDSELARVDVTTQMDEPYTPHARIGSSDVRCFVLDWPVEERTFITGIAVRPGNPSLVHHATAFLADEGEIGELRDLDARDDESGWDCTGFGLEFKPTGFIGGWTPGQRAVTFPGGLGREVPAHSAIVLQIHYSVAHGYGEDVTAIDAMIESSVEREARQMGVGNPQWLVSGGLRIAAGDPDAMFYFSFDPGAVLERDGFSVWAVNLHMHRWGKSGSLAIQRADGTTECLLDIPAWDMNWMGDYWLEEPVDVHPGDRLYVECHFDNSATNQPIVAGEVIEPHDLEWGTDMEMCGGIMTISDRGGAS